MYLVVSKDYTEYEKFLHDNFKYIGDEMDIERVDPSRIKRILLVGNFRDHPIYFTNRFLKLQFEVAAHNTVTRKKKWWQIW